MNKVIITGRLTGDPELKITPSGAHVTTFSVAVKRPMVKDKTDFFECVAWRAQAEFICNYFKKGDGIEIIGTLTNREWTDKNGNKRKVTEIECDNVAFPISSPKKDQAQIEYQITVPSAYTNVADTTFEDVTDDTRLPF